MDHGVDGRVGQGRGFLGACKVEALGLGVGGGEGCGGIEGEGEGERRLRDVCGVAGVS